MALSPKTRREEGEMLLKEGEKEEERDVAADKEAEMDEGSKERECEEGKSRGLREKNNFGKRGREKE